MPHEGDACKIAPIFCDNELHLLNGFWGESPICEVDDGRCGEYRISGLVGESFFELLKALNGFLWSAIREVQQEDLVTFVIEEGDAAVDGSLPDIFLEWHGVSCALRVVPSARKD